MNLVTWTLGRSLQCFAWELWGLLLYMCGYYVNQVFRYIITIITSLNLRVLYVSSHFYICCLHIETYNIIRVCFRSIAELDQYDFMMQWTSYRKYVLCRHCHTYSTS